jgi:hypothetical protein
MAVLLHVFNDIAKSTWHLHTPRVLDRFVSVFDLGKSEIMLKLI